MASENQRIGELQEFLAKSFAREELDRFLTLAGYDEVAKSENPNQGITHYTCAVVLGLERRGLIDTEFFERLIRERPRKEELIQGLRRSWLDEAEARRRPSDGAFSGRSEGMTSGETPVSLRQVSIRPVPRAASVPSFDLPRIPPKPGVDIGPIETRQPVRKEGPVTFLNLTGRPIVVYYRWVKLEQGRRKLKQVVEEFDGPQVWKEDFPMGEVHFDVTFDGKTSVGGGWRRLKHRAGSPTVVEFGLDNEGQVIVVAYHLTYLW